MKKPKVSIDATKLQQFFVLHVEKIAAALMVAVLLYLVYGAIMHETYLQTPSDLQQKVQQAEANINAATWGSEHAAELEITDYEAQARRVRAPIGEADDDRLVVDVWAPFNPPVRNLLTKRSAPQLLPVEELEVASGYGPIAGGGGARIGNQGPAEPAGGQRVRGLRWASVVGLVPYDEQRREYDAVFRNAHEWDGGRDIPTYEGFIVFRAEVTTGNEDEEVQWKQHYATRGQPKRDWSKGDEVVPREYIIDALCDPLPPLLNRRWGPSVSHSKIPIISQAQDEPADDAAPKEEAEAAEPEPLFVDQPAAQPPKKNEPAKEEKKPAPPHRLFRFLDYEVEPGKRYRYRVRLAIRNPNAGLHARFLDDPALAQGQWLFVDSAPSPVVSIPRSDDVLLGRSNPASGPNEESANVILTHFDENTGSTAPHEQKLFRGQVANVTVPNMNVINPMNNNVEALADVRIKPDVMLLDVVGGERLPLDRGTADEPGEMLVLDPSFRLIRRTQMADQEDFDAAKELLERIQGDGAPRKPEERRSGAFF